MIDLDPTHCSRLLRVLADPQRLRILECLSGGDHSVGELAVCLGKHVVKVSQHLAVLRRAGLVRGERRGRFVVYRLDAVRHARPDGPTGREYLDLGCCRLEWSASPPASKEC